MFVFCFQLIQPNVQFVFHRNCSYFNLLTNFLNLSRDSCVERPCDPKCKSSLLLGRKRRTEAIEDAPFSCLVHITTATQTNFLGPESSPGLAQLSQAHICMKQIKISPLPLKTAKQGDQYSEQILF